MVLLLEVMFTLSLYLLRCFEREIFKNQISGSVYRIVSSCEYRQLNKKYSTSCFVAVNTSTSAVYLRGKELRFADFDFDC